MIEARKTGPVFKPSKPADLVRPQGIKPPPPGRTKLHTGSTSMSGAMEALGELISIISAEGIIIRYRGAYGIHTAKRKFEIRGRTLRSWG